MRAGDRGGHTKLVPLVRGLERGHIAFVARPRVEGTPGVQRFSLLLSPQDSKVHRRIIVGRRRMPDSGAGEREWAYVDAVTAKGSRAELLADLGPRTYTTKTLGVRQHPGARVIAQGTYSIVEHDEHAHLTYALEPDTERDPLHDALNVAREASMIVTVFNPLASWSARSAQLSFDYGKTTTESGDAPPFREPSIYPDELQARFGDKRFLPLEPAFLDYVGAELELGSAEDEARPGLSIAV